MKTPNRIRKKFGPEARAGYAIAGAALLVLPVVVVYHEGGIGVTAGLVLSALFGIGYLTAAVFGGKIPGDGAARRHSDDASGASGESRLAEAQPRTARLASS
jgi:hypothetical protein